MSIDGDLSRLIHVYAQLCTCETCVSREAPVQHGVRSREVLKARLLREAAGRPADDAGGGAPPAAPPRGGERRRWRARAGQRVAAALLEEAGDAEDYIDGLRRGAPLTSRAKFRPTSSKSARTLLEHHRVYNREV